MEEIIDQIIRRLDLLEFKQELLFNDTPYDRLLFEANATRNQSKMIMDLMGEYRNAIEKGKEVHHGSFETEIYQIIPERDGDYHFAEFIAQDLHRAGRWQEVFEALYGDMPKFQFYMEEHRDKD